MTNYYCIQCQTEHREEGDFTIFKTGYTLKNEHKIPLGVCQVKNNERHFRIISSEVRSHT